MGRASHIVEDVGGRVISRAAAAVAIVVVGVLTISGCALEPHKLGAFPRPGYVPSRCDGFDHAETNPATAPADYLTYKQISGDIDTPVTKFGGQPHWLSTPQWPVGRVDNQPMQFIGQIALSKDLFPVAAGKMAYIFADDMASQPANTDMIDDSSDWGVGVVIIQPGGIAEVPTIAKATGPEFIDPDTKAKQVYLPDTVERKVDPSFISDTKWATMSDADLKKREFTFGDKVGGTPAFIQRDQFPGCGTIDKLLWQSVDAPFQQGLLHGGIGYAFVDPMVTTGRYFYQTHQKG